MLGVLAGLGAFVLNPARAAVGPLPAAALVLPADARFVMGFDVQRFTASPFYTRYASRPGMRPQAFIELEQKTGLDVARDLDQIVVSGTGLGRQADMLALAIGRFDVGKIGRALETEGKASAYRHQGATVWAFKGVRPARDSDDARLPRSRRAAAREQGARRGGGRQPQARASRRCARTR